MIRLHWDTVKEYNGSRSSWREEAGRMQLDVSGQTYVVGRMQMDVWTHETHQYG